MSAPKEVWISRADSVTARIEDINSRIVARAPFLGSTRYVLPSEPTDREVLGTWELRPALEAYGEGRISTRKLMELISCWQRGVPLDAFALATGESVPTEREVRLARALVNLWDEIAYWEDQRAQWHEGDPEPQGVAEARAILDQAQRAAG